MNQDEFVLLLKKKDDEIAYLKKLLNKLQPKIGGPGLNINPSQKPQTINDLGKLFDPLTVQNKLKSLSQPPTLNQNNNLFTQLPSLIPINQSIQIKKQIKTPEFKQQEFKIRELSKTTNVTCCILMSGGLNNFNKTINSMKTSFLDYDLITNWVYINAYTEPDELVNLENVINLSNHPITRQQMFITALDIINTKFSNTDYLLLLGDGIKFIKKNNYITDSLNILNNPDIGLVSLNKLSSNYEIKYDEFNNGINNSFWPCFTLRPIVYDFKLLLKMSKIEYENKYFEYHIVNNYINNYKFASLDNINYQIDLLNNFYKFILPYFKINIINTKFNNSTREFMQFFDNNCIDIREHEMKKISKLDHRLVKLFKNNSFGFRFEIMSHIITHLELWDYDCEYTNNDINIFIENHVAIPQNFMNILYNLINTLEVDILLLGDNMSGYIIKKTCMEYLYKSCANIINNLESFIYEHENDIKIGKVDLLKTNIMTPYDEDIINLEGYTFYSLLDSFGSDIKHVGGKKIEDLQYIADGDPTCVAFNTLGWMKHSVSDICSFKRFDHTRDINVGLYVKKSNIDIDSVVDYKINMLTENKDKKYLIQT